MSDQLVAQLPAMEREAGQLERRAHALRQIIEGIKALNGDATLFDVALAPNGNGNGNGHSEPEGPRGREAVRQIVTERPGAVWSLTQIKRENRRRGWPSPDKAIETAVSRLRANGEAERVSTGKYRFTVRQVVE
jgi:hypothetical protein